MRFIPIDRLTFLLFVSYAYDFLLKTVTVMKRQKMEPGSFCIMYLFPHRLTFASGLGNKKKQHRHFYLINKVVFTFKGRLILLLIQFFFSEYVLPAVMQRIKFNCSSFILVTFNTAQYLKPSLTHSWF